MQNDAQIESSNSQGNEKQLETTKIKLNVM